METKKKRNPGIGIALGPGIGLALSLAFGANTATLNNTWPMGWLLVLPRVH